ncbi:sulfite exporter TauE/SafE family protein [Nocardioides sp. MJB4]|uniref:Probable membrane transporter protein n=1 Tax=Nocardioides donggukensis TaxID=2774019 RepID=A0A927Q1N3_9ACTN|nr:sulfite exporter TauE/SafE family protein [Nocardioides donggukensis]
MSPGVVLAIALAVLVGAFVQAVVGLGVGLITAPVIAVLAPELVPSLPLWFGLFVAGVSFFGEREHVDWPAIGWSLPARVPGTALGVWLVVVFTPEQLGVALGLTVLLAVLLSVRSVSVPITRATLVGAGFTSGVTGTATSIGGPPIALLFQHRRPSEARSTLAVFFFLGVVLSLSALGLSGEIPVESLLIALLLAPLMAVGIRVGIQVRDDVPRARFRQLVLVVCAFAAVVLLVKSVA